MNEQVAWIMASIAGAVLGLGYFWGLWMTVQAVPRAGHPALLTFGSFILRTAACVAGFYFVSGGRWERLLLALVGFVVVRTVLVRYAFERRTDGSVRDNRNGDIAG